MNEVDNFRQDSKKNVYKTTPGECYGITVKILGINKFSEY